MITGVVKLEEGKYKINDAIILSNLDFCEDGVSFKIDYDENMLTEEEANSISDEFINLALKAAQA